ncbi:response regulator [Legionella parisiensis]|uniref:Alkaline phosphatase synthesis transcriptional regulatory protein PhoP n=1 Tax=Legionella parisiensis TaxID=45071 RepID=A0A1E5JWH4_9GAMM|nr:response regulator [Legionella parisiensis]KTD41791.1 two-component response regulator [Legionella parisiensis]OEH48861.1 Alkaline phosphatase synthesis transcriptional regulatory protein PhoP [Legionella parisiensis]STX75884.1 two-component response regulator [Legionella parisiensis]
MTTKLKKILYAEDEEDIRAIAQIALEDIGDYEVKYCSNGQDVLSAAQTFTPDLILLDVMMPFKDGPTTLQELRKLNSFSSIPAVFMTAKIQTQEIEEYKEMGVVDVIAKPFNPMELANELNKIWIRYHGKNT